ncbi:MAG TPA: hypothetical protein VJO35_03025 [Terriglobales bacterium]|nr:hypothetical protein [Terriglobales bacterium]
MLHLRHCLRRVLAFSFLFPSLALAQAPAASPQKITPGSSAVDGSFLKPYKNAWKIVYEFPGREPFLVGMWTDELSEVEVNGRHLLKRSQMADYAKYGIVSTYVNVFDPKTMAPVYSDFKRSDTGEWAHREFDGARVTYRKAESAEAKTQTGELKLSEPIFDYNGGLYGVLLAALPLKEGLQASLPTLSEDRDVLDPVTVTVGKQELTDAGPVKQVLAWPVDTEANYANHSHSIFWITKDPPYVIKLVTLCY